MVDALSKEAITARLRTATMGQLVEVHERIDSTQTRAVMLARVNTPEGAVVLAESQTAGRGRLGRRWHAPPGSGLLMSLLFRPRLTPAQAQRITMICSLAVVQAVHEMTACQARIKWPNDIVIGSRKLGGLLTELGVDGGRLSYVVVGLGINVNLDLGDLPEVMTPPTSLSQELGHPVSRLELLLSILDGIELRYAQLRAGWSPHEEWRRHLATIGQRVKVGISSEEAVEGLALDVDEDGALLVEGDGGAPRRVLVGDVTLRAH